MLRDRVRLLPRARQLCSYIIIRICVNRSRGVYFFNEKPAHNTCFMLDIYFSHTLSLSLSSSKTLAFSLSLSLPVFSSFVKCVLLPIEL